MKTELIKFKQQILMQAQTPAGAIKTENTKGRNVTLGLRSDYYTQGNVSRSSFGLNSTPPRRNPSPSVIMKNGIDEEYENLDLSNP